MGVLRSLWTVYLLSFVPLVLFSLSQGLAPVGAQNSSPYVPIANAGSAILSDGALYLYGGVSAFAPDPNGLNTGTNQFLRLDLTHDFNTTAPPWTRLPNYLTYTMIEAAPSKNGKQFILGGNRDNNGPLSYIYDISSTNWIAAPNLPYLSSMNGYKRWNAGMALDPVTGLITIYGGFPFMSFSKELSILNTTSTDPAQMSWTYSVNQTVIPPLYNPMVLYLPTLSKTIVLGGCDTYNGLTGRISSCALLTTVYLFSSSEPNLIQPRTLMMGPKPRYQVCRVVLDDGNVFIQGGRDLTSFFGDAWILDVSNWTWSTITINGPAEAMTRAGHTCQMGPNGQIIAVGGFVDNANISSYVQPYMAVIDTKTWTWKTTFNGAPVGSIWKYASTPESNGGSTSKSSGGLSSGVKGGIGAGVAVIVLGLGAGLFLRRKRRLSSNPDQSKDHHEMKPSGTLPPSKAEKSLATGSNYNLNNRSDLEQLTYSSGHNSPTPTTAAAYPAYTTYHQTGTTLPIYTTIPLEYPSSPAMATTYQETSKYPSGAFESNTATTDEAALAAALFQAEDSVSSRQLSMKSEYCTHSSPSLYHDSIPLQHHIAHPTVVPPIVYPTAFSQASSIPSSTSVPRTKPAIPVSAPSGSLSLSPSSSPTSSHEQLVSTFSTSRPPTIHTSAINTIPTPSEGFGGTNRGAHAPQSVPEHDAWIERSSPGVKTHFMKRRDLDKDGLYPPLTPTRMQSSHSILVGAPALPVASAPSFSAASSSLKSLPRESDAGMRARYFDPKGIAAAGAVGRNGNNGSPYSNGEGGGMEQEQKDPSAQRSNGAPHSPASLYRDPQMMKDLDNIAKLIESQTLAEPKHPHAIVAPSPDDE